jgi:hypothetical protein
METLQNPLIPFLTYLMSKPGTNATDRFVFLLQVLKPELYNTALKWVFPGVSSLLSNDSPAALRSFAEKHADELVLPNGTLIDINEIEYDKVLLAMFF